MELLKLAGSVSVQCDSEEAAKQVLEELTLAWLNQHFRSFLDRHGGFNARRPPQPSPG
jgi:hypothetical protein